MRLFLKQKYKIPQYHKKNISELKLNWYQYFLFLVRAYMESEKKKGMDKWKKDGKCIVCTNKSEEN